MARNRYRADEIIAKLPQVDVLVSQGQNIGNAIRQIGVGDVTHFVPERISFDFAFISSW